MLLKELVEKKLTSYQEGFDNWKDAVVANGEVLKAQGYIEDEYVDAVIACIEKYGPYELDNDYKCAVVGVLRYRGLELPVYCDDYGMCDFIVYDGKTIEVDSFGGPTDWYYVLDKYIDKIYN